MALKPTAMETSVKTHLLLCFAFTVSAARAEDQPGSGPIEKNPEGHSYHGAVFNEGPRQSARLMQGTGKVNFPVHSSKPLVQDFINQGVGQLHGFWFFEAERSFRQAASIDPDCAAAYWGMAMANVNNADRARQFIAEAVKRRDKADPRVQKYIDALDALLKADKKNREAARKYIKDLERIVYEYPDDIEAMAFIALHIWQSREDGLRIDSYLAVDSLIERVLQAEPMHPIHHYRIHLWDYEQPERALRSAALCGQSAPAVAHMWHMPGHIYSRLKRYNDAVWQQEASARTDHAQMMRDRLLPDQIHNFAHNNEWLIRDMIFTGQISEAVSLAKNMIELPRHPSYNGLDKDNSSASFGRARLFQVLAQAELWNELIALADTPYLEPTSDFGEQVKRERYLGRAYFRTGSMEAGKKIIHGLELRLCSVHDDREREMAEAWTKAKADGANDKKAERAEKDVREDYDRKLKSIERALDELNGYVALASHDFERALKLLDEAGERDQPLLARIHLQKGDAEQAVSLMNDYVEDNQQETIPLAHLVEVAWLAGKRDESREAFHKLREISSAIDLSAPPFARLSKIAHELGLADDWRIIKPPASDVGNRPPLESLGPFRWQPSQAPDFEVVDQDGKKVSLASFAGRPVIVIFYLGFGCLHCAEQLQAFAPQAEEFAAAGIELFAISSDSASGLQKSLAGFGGDFPIRLAADEPLDVFKKYRVYDDFEHQPLHGIFLIDGKQRIRWQDISFKPFMDHQFLLKESMRLLSQPIESPDDPLAPILSKRL
jgi:peroxiredoxin